MVKVIRGLIIVTAVLLAIMLVSCSSGEEDKSTAEGNKTENSETPDNGALGGEMPDNGAESDETENQTEPPNIVETANKEVILRIEDETYKLEAEEHQFVDASIDTALSGYSGTGYVTGFKFMPSNIKFTFTVEEAINVKVEFCVNLPVDGEYYSSQVYLNGAKIGTMYYDGNGDFKMEAFGSHVKLEPGEHTLLLSANPQNLAIDYMLLTQAEPEVERQTAVIDDKVVDMDLTVNTKKVYSYLLQNYGKQIISGQQASAGEERYIAAIEAVTGKTPALRGFDFMDYSPSRVERGTVGRDTEAAIEWWKSGGLVTFCWHWNAPKDLIDTEDNKWWSGFYTRATTFDFAGAMADMEGEDFQLLIRDIDAIAEQLKILEAADVPVLWRPLHEASGGWFWWGSAGSKPYIELWQFMYRRLNDYHGLKNLIWVWNGQDAEWYPGDEYVDMMGEDIYAPERDYSSQKARFDSCAGATDADKIIALTENGVIPDPDELINDGVKWAWFCTWGGEFVVDDDGRYSSKYTEESMLKKVYSHDYVITKDELPVFNYELEYDLAELIERMGLGWNLGNTFDATSNNETAWGNPLTTKKLIDQIAEQGFGSIRIPITWNARLGTTEPYTIRPDFLERIKEVVDWSLKAGLVTIINMHHDSEWLRDMPNNRVDDLQRFTACWEQIAGFFRDYPETLIFEGINEPRFSDDWGLDTPEFFECLDDLQTSFYNTVRSSGGNNAHRPLIFTALTGSSSDARFDELDKTLDKFSEDKALIATFHYYGYYHFTINVGGATTFNRTVKDDITQVFDRVYNRYHERGIPVIIGEHGLLTYDIQMDGVDHAESMKYYEYSSYYASQKGMCLMLWDNGQHFDRINGVWRDPQLHATLLNGSTGARSSYAESDRLYIKRGSELTDTSIDLHLNGNTLTSVMYNETELTRGVDYDEDGSKITILKSFIESVYSDETGTCAALVLKFSGGVDWNLYITVYDDAVFEPLESAVNNFDIPVQFNGNQVATLETVYESGGNAGPANWTSFKQFNYAFFVDYDSNVLSLKKALFDEVRDDAKVNVRVHMKNGDIYKYTFTKSGNDVVGAPAD